MTTSYYELDIDIFSVLEFINMSNRCLIQTKTCRYIVLNFINISKSEYKSSVSKIKFTPIGYQFGIYQNNLGKGSLCLHLK